MKYILGITLVILTACSTTRNFTHNQQIAPFIADGKANDWGDNLLFDASSRLLYKVSNDANNLYIMAKISDEQMQRKVLMGGFTVFIDTTNHRKELFSITYPRGKGMGSGRSRPRESDQEPNEKRKFDIRERLAEGELEMELRTYNDQEPRILFPGESKLRPVIDVDSSQSLVYEFVLPLGYFIKNRESPKPISIGFMIGSKPESNGRQDGFGRNEEGEDRENGEGMHMGMSGGGRHGGMGGGRPGGGSFGEGHRGGANESGSREPNKIWLKDYVLTSIK